MQPATWAVEHTDRDLFAVWYMHPLYPPQRAFVGPLEEAMRLARLYEALGVENAPEEPDVANMPIEQMRAELAAAGIDTTRAFERVKAAIREAR